MWYEPILERGLLPDVALRMGIRSQLRARLRQEGHGDDERLRARRLDFLRARRQGAIAVQTAAANEQHYEVPAAFYAEVLGPRRKYSSGLWPEGCTSLAASEEAMLDLYVERARLEDGQEILDLGCGWGSLSLYLGERLPNARITAVSNSERQRRYVQARADADGLAVTPTRADISEFRPAGTFDRIVSIEMFEHMSNYRALLERIASWLRPEGLLFVHHFAHRQLNYPFRSGATNEWMATHFFSGGIMPSVDLLDEFPEHLRVLEKWHVEGTHYQKTCEAWLKRMARRRPEILDIFSTEYGAAEARKHFHYWRIFFMACAELFGYRHGREWLVVHSLLEPTQSASTLRETMQCGS